MAIPTGKFNKKKKSSGLPDLTSTFNKKPKKENNDDFVPLTPDEVDKADENDNKEDEELTEVVQKETIGTPLKKAVNNSTQKPEPNPQPPSLEDNSDPEIPIVENTDKQENKEPVNENNNSQSNVTDDTAALKDEPTHATPEIQYNKDGEVELNTPFPKKLEEDNKKLNDDDKFIDKKKLRIIPLGGKKSKKNKTFIARSGDFDKRNNLLATVRIFRLIIMLVILGLFGMGIYNTFFPSHVYTEEDIANIAKETVGDSGFPMNRGRAFAEAFVQEYLTINSNDSNSNAQLNYFYTGKMNGTGDGSHDNQRQITGTVNQSVVLAPQVYSEIAASNYSATYYVTALVTGDNGKTMSDDDNTVTTKWVSFAVNVYYNSKKQMMSITKDSPQLIPTYKVGSDNSIPNEAKLGTGTEDTNMETTLKPTIQGFLSGYGASSSTSHNALNQYVKSNSDVSLYSGFGGQYEYKPNDNYQALVYPVSSSKSNSEWKVDLTATWADTKTTGSKEIKYTGRYVMSIKQGSDGKYFVTGFNPYTFVKDTSSDN